MAEAVRRRERAWAAYRRRLLRRTFAASTALVVLATQAAEAFFF